MESTGIAFRTSATGSGAGAAPTASRSAGVPSTSGGGIPRPSGAAASSAPAASSRLVGGHRASEPIYLDMDLPSPSPRLQQQQQYQLHPSQQSGRKQRKSKRKSLPKLENLTPPVFMTEEKKEALKEYAEMRIAAALEKSQAAWDGTSGIFDDPKAWKLHVTKPNLAVYRRRDGPGSDQSISTYRPFVATGRVANMTLADVEYGLYVETTPDERAANAFWFSDFFLDAAILETYETQTEDDAFHFFGVKWLLTGTLGGVKIMSPRDSVYVQYCKTVISPKGEKVLVKFVHSVGEDVVPLIPDQGDLHFVRSEISIVYMYHFDAKAKEVQVFAEGKVDPAGRSPSWMANLHLSLFAPIIVNIEYIADVKYISKHGLMYPHDYSPSHNGGDDTKSYAPSVSTWIASPIAQSTSARTDSKMSHITAASWVPDHQRKACFVCFKSFGLIRRHRHHCRMCGEVMCSKCMVTLPLVAPPTFDAEKDAHFPLQNLPASKKLEDSNQHGFPVVNTFKFCKKCILAARQERRAMVAGVGDYYFNEGMMRHYEQMRAGLGFGGVDNQLGEDGEQVHRDDEVDDDDDDDDDDDIEDDETYSQRIEKLRQEHMAREKQKNLAHAQSHHAYRSSSNVRLLEEEDNENDTKVAAPAASMNQQQCDADGSEASYNFDNLLATDTKHSLLQEAQLKSKSESESISTMATGLPPTATGMPTRETIGGHARKMPLPPVMDARQRSFSIPENFEKMERTIAEQEALLSTIKQQGEGHKDVISPEEVNAAMKSLAIAAAKTQEQENKSKNLHNQSNQESNAPTANDDSE
ncbi:1-phosphatidylinositol 3-phosphate 5-kinase, partial [Globisporangium splendens]